MMGELLLQIFLETLVFPQQFFMVTLEISAQFPKGLDEPLKPLGIGKPLVLLSAVPVLQRRFLVICIERI